MICFKVLLSLSLNDLTQQLFNFGNILFSFSNYDDSETIQIFINWQSWDHNKKDQSYDDNSGDDDDHVDSNIFKSLSIGTVG